MDTTKDPGEPRTPNPEILKEIFAKARPEIEALFRRYWISAEEAEELLDDAVLIMLLRWERIDDPQPWLLATLHQAIRRRLIAELWGEDNPEDRPDRNVEFLQ